MNRIFLVVCVALGHFYWFGGSLAPLLTWSIRICFELGRAIY